MANSVKDPLISMIDSAVIRLLELVDPGSVGSRGEAQMVLDGEARTETVGFIDRVKAIELGTRWVAIKNKLPDGDTTDEFERLRQGHIRGAGRGRASATSRTNGAGTA